MFSTLVKHAISYYISYMDIQKTEQEGVEFFDTFCFGR